MPSEFYKEGPSMGTAPQPGRIPLSSDAFEVFDWDLEIDEAPKRARGVIEVELVAAGRGTPHLFED